MSNKDIVDENGCFAANTDLELGFRTLISRNQRTPILDLRGISMSALPADIFKINGLEELYLDQNQLTELPETIGKIENLRVLSLGRNLIRRLPTSLTERWATLQKLFLGDNQITELGFNEEELWAFQQGSIGLNRIAEPIGRNWMVREDAYDIPQIMKKFVPPKLPSAIAASLAEQFIQIIELASEPMVFEILYEQMVLSSSGRFHWNDHFDRPWLRYIAVSLLPNIVRGSMVHESLWLWNIKNVDISELPMKPNCNFPEKVAILGDIK